MTHKELSRLICPYCHSHFHLHKIIKKDNYQIEYGTAFCHCDEFPIVFGILYLHKKNNKIVVNYLKKGHLLKSLITSFEFGKIKTILFILFTHLNKFLRVSPNNFINQFLIKLLWKMPSSQFKYYFSRRQEIESLLFFLPLSFRQLKTNSIWLDVGSGVSNYYPELLKLYPKLTLISQENLFQNIYLSRFFFPEKIIYICSDFSSGPILPSKCLDIITFIDSLPFMENQRLSLDISTNFLLNKNGLLYASNIIEHLYTHDYSHSFPLSMKLIKEFLPSTPQFFDEIKLCQQLNLKKSLLSSNSTPRFRYSFIWPSQKIPKNLFIPQSLLQNKHSLWQNPNIQWQNKIY